MSLSLFRFRCFIPLLAVAGFLAGVVAPVASAQTTTFTGTVYSPNGPTAGDPLPNVLVFVEDSMDPNNLAPVFSKGVAVQNGSPAGCALQPSLVPNVVLGSALTKPDGTFSFNVAGVLPDPVHLYIQAGKWRLLTSTPLANINVGGSNSFTLSMPSKAVGPTTLGGPNVADLPTVAVVTGSADNIECIFPEIGIAATEITDPTGTGHINFFLGDGSKGEKISTATPAASQLFTSSTTPLTNYDLVVFGCQGPSGLNTDPDAANTTDLNSIVSYANSGGRVFATHWEYPWVHSPQAWQQLSSFSSSTSTANGTQTGTLATTGNYYTGEPTLAAWMNDIGAFDVNASQLQFTLTNVFPNNVQAVYTPAQTWLTVTVSPYGTTPNQFSFDTPVGASGTPAAALNFSNSTSTFLTGDPDDVVTIAVSNTSSTPTTVGLALNLTIPSVLQILSVADSSGGSWNCNATSSTTYVCTLPVPLAAGASDSVAISFKIPLGTPLGVYSLTGMLSGGGLNGTSQCGRVLYNDYHVESLGFGAATTFSSAACISKNGSKLDNAQKFLEYSLYNLSTFVAPANSDTIQIQQSSTITWNPPSPTYYGITIAQIENATVNTPGTTTYAITPMGPDLLDAGSYVFKASFMPTDSTDYLSATATENIGILPDPTTAAINGLATPIYYGQEIGYENGTSATVLIATQQGLPNLLTTPMVKGGT